MSDLNVIQIFEGELEPVTSFSCEMEAIDFFPHPLEDSSGDLIVDSAGNLLTDASPGPAEPLSSEIEVIIS